MRRRCRRHSAQFEPRELDVDDPLRASERNSSAAEGVEAPRAPLGAAQQRVPEAALEAHLSG